jgi:hypothetical protein
MLASFLAVERLTLRTASSPDLRLLSLRTRIVVRSLSTPPLTEQPFEVGFSRRVEPGEKERPVRLELLTSPTLVGVRGPDDQVLPALLMARRGDRRFVQVSRGPGCNSLVWVDAADVLAAGASVPVSAAGPSLDAPLPSAPSRGAPRALR